MGANHWGHAFMGANNDIHIGREQSPGRGWHWNGASLRRAMSLHLRSRTSFYDDNSICRKHSWWLVHTWWLSSAVPTMIEKPILGAGLKHFLLEGLKALSTFLSSVHSFLCVSGVILPRANPRQGWALKRQTSQKGNEFTFAITYIALWRWHYILVPDKNIYDELLIHHGSVQPCQLL
jgi:hypothetical protein